MNRLSTAALAALFAQNLAAQTIDRQVVGSAGLVGSTGSVEMLANVGEVATATFSSGSFEITQGFEQPDQKPDAVFSPKILVEFSVFPNPSAGELTVEIFPEKEVELGLRLFSADGRLVRELEKPALYFLGKNRKSFTLNELAAGQYLLAATDRAGRAVKTLAVFKI